MMPEQVHKSQPWYKDEEVEEEMEPEKEEEK
jgi:hypothetical protein